MKKLTFKRQICLALGIMILCFIIATATKLSFIHNLGWIIYGLSFIIHPVWPESLAYADPKKMIRYCRIAGIIVIAIALITRFGV